MKISIKKLFIVTLLTNALVSCSNDYVPKPHGYPRIDFPTREYTEFDEGCPFKMEIPTYSRMIKDTTDIFEPCWYNMFIPAFDATLHLSYKRFDNKLQLDSMMEDAYKLVFKHTIKAEDIEEVDITSSKGNSGIFYNIAGNTATPLNFYLTDGKQSYMRGAFYFNNHTQRDSVAPVVDFVTEDIWKMINSLEFK